MVFLSRIFGASYIMFNNTINSLYNKKPSSKFWPITKVVVLTYVVAGFAGVTLGKFHSQNVWAAYIVGGLISLIAIRWIEIIRRRP
jgi:hypothetical protein